MTKMFIDKFIEIVSAVLQLPLALINQPGSGDLSVTSFSMKTTEEYFHLLVKQMKHGEGEPFNPQ